MKVLLVKMSSLGDAFHTIPAINDAYLKLPNIEFHWVIEEAFAEVAGWHPAVGKVIPMAWRRWRKSLTEPSVRAEMQLFFRTLKEHQYDFIIDAQSLVKSAVVSRFGKGPRYGMDRRSCRESLASLAYDHRFSVAKDQHAITRIRQLFSQALQYQIDADKIDYGIDVQRWQKPTLARPYWLFLHGTTWETKHWPEDYWLELAQRVTAAGDPVVLAWGNEVEKARAERIASQVNDVLVLPKLSLNDVTAYLAYAKAIVGLDTGLCHIAAVMQVPTIAIYGSTDPKLAGVLGPEVDVITSQRSCAPCKAKECPQPSDSGVQPPCYQQITPSYVYQLMMTKLT